MRALPVFLAALFAMPALAWADSVPGPAARSFFLFGPPIGVAPARATAPAATPPARMVADVCRQATRVAGKAAAVPDHLLSAIARIESGRADGSGGTAPWPWSINVEGVDHVYDSKAAAIAGVLAFQAQGIRSIDVGCMQVNLAYHPNAFSGLEQAFDPVANANYAARFLVQLRDQTGSWDNAVAAYHSATPERGGPYRRKVMAALPEEQRIASLTPSPIAGLPASPGATGGGGGGTMLSNDAVHARILPLAANAPPGRDLGAYRNSPIPVTGRLLPMVVSRMTGGPGRAMPPA